MPTERPSSPRETAKKRGGRAHLPLDLAGADGRFACEPADDRTPERTFDRQWALGVLDRERGTFLLGVPFARQTWSDGLDSNGRPIPPADKHASVQGVSTYPGAKGATNWWSPSYDPDQTIISAPAPRQSGQVMLLMYGSSLARVGPPPAA